MRVVSFNQGEADVGLRVDAFNGAIMSSVEEVIEWKSANRFSVLEEEVRASVI